MEWDESYYKGFAFNLKYEPELASLTWTVSATCDVISNIPNNPDLSSRVIHTIAFEWDLVTAAGYHAYWGVLVTENDNVELNGDIHTINYNVRDPYVTVGFNVLLQPL